MKSLFAPHGRQTDHFGPCRPACRSGQVIAEINEVVDEELRRRLSEIDQRIAELDRKSEAEVTRQRARRLELDQQIQAATKELDAAVSSGRDDWIAEAHAKLSNLQAERAELESIVRRPRPPS